MRLFKASMWESFLVLQQRQSPGHYILTSLETFYDHDFLTSLPAFLRWSGTH